MRKCIDSILAQTFIDFECLLIDDGSTDESPTICDEYAQNDSRVKVFHKPNGGLSDARNYGLERAQGKYTIFTDPDDWVDVEGLNKLYEIAKREDAGITICDVYYNDPYQQKYGKQQPTSLNHLDLIKDLLTDKIYGYTWNKLIRTDLYKLYQIEYPYGMYGCEDQYTMCKLLKHNIKVSYVPIAFYHYMHYDQDSLSRHYDEMTYQHDLKIRDMFVGILQDEQELMKIAYESKSLYLIARAFKYGQKQFNNKQFKQEFYSYRKLIKTSSMTSIVRIPAYFSCFGNYHFWNWIFWKGFLTKQNFKILKWRYQHLLFKNIPS